jgi:hypothetical protein
MTVENDLEEFLRENFLVSLDTMKKSDPSSYEFQRAYQQVMYYVMNVERKNRKIILLEKLAKEEKL